MSGELDYISSDYAAFHWALGFLLASYLERVRVMSTESLYPPRWLLSLEMFICFVPLTFFAVVLFVASMIGIMPMQTALPNLSATLIGPIGLLVAFRMIVLGRTRLSRPAIVVLCLLAAWTLLAFILLAGSGTGPIGLWAWREFVLIALLPAIGCAHLIFISSKAASRPALT